MLGSLCCKFDLHHFHFIRDSIGRFTAEKGAHTYHTLVLTLGVNRFDLVSQRSFSICILVIDNFINLDDNFLSLMQVFLCLLLGE
jgi:hypothetical protein